MKPIVQPILVPVTSPTLCSAYLHDHTPQPPADTPGFQLLQSNDNDCGSCWEVIGRASCLGAQLSRYIIILSLPSGLQLHQGGQASSKGAPKHLYTVCGAALTFPLTVPVSLSGCWRTSLLEERIFTPGGVSSVATSAVPPNWLISCSCKFVRCLA